MVSRDSVKFDVVFDKGVSGLFVDHRWMIVCSMYLSLSGVARFLHDASVMNDGVFFLVSVVTLFVVIVEAVLFVRRINSVRVGARSVNVRRVGAAVDDFGWSVVSYDGAVAFDNGAVFADADGVLFAVVSVDVCDSGVWHVTCERVDDSLVGSSV